MDAYDGRQRLALVERVAVVLDRRSEDLKRPVVGIETALEFLIYASVTGEIAKSHDCFVAGFEVESAEMLPAHIDHMPAPVDSDQFRRRYNDDCCETMAVEYDLVPVLLLDLPARLATIKT